MGEEIGDWPLDRITQEALVVWAKGRYPRYAYATTRAHLIALGAVLTSISDGPPKRPVDVFASHGARRLIMKNLMPKSSSKKQPCVSDAQLADLEAVWRPTSFPFDVVLFAVASSFRISEICRI